MRALAISIAVLMAAAATPESAGSASRTARADPVRPTYKNPVLFADYSDPDAIRVGSDFYLVASSFGSVPGLPILHSRNLVDWTIVAHAAPRLPSPDFDTPQHGKGMWAPSLRHHAGRFWIYVGDPDRGIFVTTAADPRGPWTPLALVKAAKGAIDPCPLWDDDGNVYLVHAWAKSRAGFNSVLTVTPLSRDGLKTAGPDTQVFDGHAAHPTIEGPKFYKRNGWYYIFAPAGGVATGWQTVLRSKSVLGAYEDRIVLRQGTSSVNGPHQGAWVETESGESWFLHFQDRGAYGRVVHLQPMSWKADWPVIGVDPDGDGVGEPVTSFRRPSVASMDIPPALQISDEFAAATLGLQWQWNANPALDWISFEKRKGFARLSVIPGTASAPSVFGLGNLLLQKFPAEAFRATTLLDAAVLPEGASAGLVIAGRDTGALGVSRTTRGFVIRPLIGRDVDKDGRDVWGEPVASEASRIWLRAEIEKTDVSNPAEASPLARFSYSLDGTAFVALGEPFHVRPGVWVGARIGLFTLGAAAPGAADFDWFRIEQAKP